MQTNTRPAWMAKAPAPTQAPEPVIAGASIRPTFMKAKPTKPKGEPCLKKWSFSAWSLFKDVPYILYAQEVIGGRPREANEAAKRGVMLHQGIEDYINGTADDCHPAAKKFVNILKHNGYGVKAEATFWLDAAWKKLDTQEGKALTAILDVLAIHEDGRVIVADWKTGKRYDLKHTQQGQLYVAVLHEVLGIDHAKVRFEYLDGHEPLVIDYNERLIKQAVDFWKAEGEKMLTATKMDFAPPETLQGIPKFYHEWLTDPNSYHPDHFPAPWYVRG